MSRPQRTAVDREIQRLLGRGSTLPGALPALAHGDLWRAFARATEGGKRARPVLLLAAHEAFGGGRHEAAVQVGAALELLHTSFVIQDDVIDGDETRRGAPNLPGSVAAEAREQGASPAGSRRLGVAAGILAGDLGLVAALRAVARCDAPGPVVDRLLDLFESTLHTSAAGELADVRLQLTPAEQPAALRDALAVAELKTAAYSFQLPLHAGALLAGARPAQLTALDEVGALLGIGFQLIDDLLGVFGNEQRTGKSALGDLREGKRTALIAHASTTASLPRLRPLVGRDALDAEQAREARRLLTAAGSRTWVEDLAHWHLDSAVEAAERHALPAPLVDALGRAALEIRRTAAQSLLPLEETAQPLEEAERPSRPSAAREGLPA